MLNLYYALIPSIDSLTTGLISWTELPSTFTSWFGNIGSNIGMVGNSMSGFGSFISKLSLNLPSLIGMDDASE